MDKFLHPIIVAFAWVWVKIHDLVVAFGLAGGNGHGWILSIVLLTLLVRILIIPLYIKQIKSTRNMQVLQPELQKLQAKYKGKTDTASRQRQSEEMMALYKEHGTSPYSSCLPLAVQMPVLFALYRVIFAVEALSAGTYPYNSLGPLTKDVAAQIKGSQLFGVSLFESLSTTAGMGKLTFIILIIVMVGFQFLTMRMSMSKNMPKAQDPSNPMVRSQKMMMYLMPAMFIFTGVVFKMALLVYMVTTTIFSWAQQLWVLLYMPTPGSTAHEKLVGKREAKFQKWAREEFAQYDRKLEAVKDDPDKVAQLNIDTLTSIEAKAKRDKVDTEFPDTWDVPDKLRVYRTLALEPWKTIPDAGWKRELLRSRKAASETTARRAKQPKKLSREQRLRRQQIEAQDEQARQRAEERASRKAAKKTPGSDLSAEEKERRRQERRAAQRDKKKRQ